MTLYELLEKLNEDLAREYSHWHFYMRASAVVTGLHREEFSELFKEEAEGEMNHILEFSKLILGLGGVPTTRVALFDDDASDPTELIEQALKMEQEVVANYVQRMDDAEALERDDYARGESKVNGRYIHIFLEDQIMDSRKAVDNYKQILRGL